MKWHRYVLHSLIVAIVLAAMSWPAYAHLDWTPKYVLASLAGIALIIIAAVAFAFLVVRRKKNNAN